MCFSLCSVCCFITIGCIVYGFDLLLVICYILGLFVSLYVVIFLLIVACYVIICVVLLFVLD